MSIGQGSSPPETQGGRNGAAGADDEWKGMESLHGPGGSAGLPVGTLRCHSSGCARPLLAGFSLNPRRYLSKLAQEKVQRNASRLAWHSVRKEIQDPSARNVPQEGEDEVVPSEHPQEEEKWDTDNQHPWGRLEGTKTYPESGVAPGIEPALDAL